MPEPVGPQTATISPGSTTRSRSRSTSSSPPYAKCTASKRTPSGPAGRCLRRLRLGQRLDPLEPREAAARRRERALREVRDPAERLERPDELEQQRLEEDELADRQVAADHLPAAEEDDRGDRERRQVVEPGQVPRLDARLAQHGVAHGLGLARRSGRGRRPRGRTPAPSRCRRRPRRPPRSRRPSAPAPGARAARRGARSAARAR